MSEPQIQILHPNGEHKERYALHVEASRAEEWQCAIECLQPGETAIFYDESGVPILKLTTPSR